jgi:hypothetical protein
MTLTITRTLMKEFAIWRMGLMRRSRGARGVTKFLGHQLPEVRAAAVMALAELGEREALIRVLKHGRSDTRVTAAQKLGAFDHPDVVEILWERIRNDPLEEVELQAIRALGQLKAYDRLSGLLEWKNGRIRCAVYEIFEQAGVWMPEMRANPMRLDIEQLEFALDRMNPAMYRRTKKQGGIVGPPSADVSGADDPLPGKPDLARGEIESVEEDPRRHTWIARAAAEACQCIRNLAMIGDHGALPILREAELSEDESVRRAAQLAIAAVESRLPEDGSAYGD